MGKAVNDSVLDAALDYIKGATQITVCTTNQPATFAQATSTNNYMLATTTMTTADYSIANGDTSGRKITIAQQENVSIVKTGTAGHVCLVNTTASELILVTSCNSQSLTTGGTVTIPAFDDEIADPS